ncbi:FAD-binding protein [Kitasatospora acidiphila]|uniref:FAD-binding protein n=1 Tax=Kitasatospora acidiphila TaxID=2567942 RepID=A0A540VYD7_9ACTN|nr:FAD-dependent monooxygenase [Kitasatospora acidiphila]TQF01755.1 FAD-binding protein [Kitasatospora acidiphila]
MRTSRSTEVLIVGAGPVGLALAVTLARSGVNCRVIERDPRFREHSLRARGINPRTLEVFDDLGIVDEIYARGELNLKIRSYQGPRIVSEVDPAAANSPTPDRPHLGMMMLAQHHTEAVLRGRLADYGVKVELDTALVDYTQDADQVTATVQHGEHSEQITARYLIGCDGGRSTVRKLTGIPFLGETWDEERYLMAAVQIDGLDLDYLHLWEDAEFGVGALALIPLRSDGNWAVNAAVRPDRHGEVPEPTLPVFRRLFAERAGLPGVELRDLVWSTVWRPTVRMVERYRSGRVFLAGDAAHCHSAAGGQGMNTGIQDAHNLGWKLAAVLRGAPDALLDSYQAERLPVARAVLDATTVQHRALFKEGGANALADQFRNRTSAAGSDFSGLSIAYRGGPLSRDLDGSTGIRAGDRAPDAPCRTANGHPVRLFDLFRGAHFTLLHFSDRPPLPGLPSLPLLRQETVHDPAGHARRAYGITGDAMVLVRPDGYVALTGGAADLGRFSDCVHELVR